MSDQIDGSVPGCTARQALGHDYDHYDPEFALDPHPAYRRLRGACLISRCICSRYVPLRYQRRPANPLIGRLRFRKRR